MFGKLMSISDELMWRYIELLSSTSPDAIAQWKSDVASGRNPRDIKVAFAQEIVERFHGRAAADKALADFEARFREGAMPEQMPEVEVRASSDGIALPQVLKQAGLTASTSEALRMIEQGGVKVNGEKVSDKTRKLANGEQVVLQVGKRKFARVKIC
jgi:tyrosyl-tRNA synthetase